MTKIQDAYEDGVCPDCQEEIPEDTVDGEECKNCGHVFWAIPSSSNGQDTGFSIRQ